MRINLLPKEKRNKSKISFSPNRIAILTGIAIMIFGLCFYLGYLYFQISVNKSRLERLNLEAKCYSTQYRKVKEIEAALNLLHDKNNLKKTVSTNYLTPLNVLTTLIQSKPDLIWFERIQFSSSNGSFILTGGAINYKAFAAFISQLELNKAAITSIKPEQATVLNNSAGREYIQFKISGILAKGSETVVQNN